jgi:hypothetical protein
MSEPWKPQPWGYDVESRLKIGSMGHGVETGCPDAAGGGPCRDCDEAAVLAELAALRAQIGEAVRIAGEAIGTDPSLRSVACVQVLADRAERLSQQVEELTAKLASAIPEDVMMRNTELAIEVEELCQAVGLATTLGPKVVMDPDRPLLTMQEVVASANQQVEDLTRERDQILGYHQHAKAEVESLSSGLATSQEFSAEAWREADRQRLRAERAEAKFAAVVEAAKPEARDVEQAQERLIAFATECETEHAPQLEGSVTADAGALAADLWALLSSHERLTHEVADAKRSRDDAVGRCVEAQSEVERLKVLVVALWGAVTNVDAEETAQAIQNEAPSE